MLPVAHQKKKKKKMLYTMRFFYFNFINRKKKQCAIFLSIEQEDIDTQTIP